MTHLECPTCRQFVSDHALDAGQCPFCGYDGAMVVAASPKRAWLIATVAVVVGGACARGVLAHPPRSTNPHSRPSRPPFRTPERLCLIRPYQPYWSQRRRPG